MKITMVIPAKITTKAPNTEASIMFTVSPDQQVLPPLHAYVRSG